MTSAHINLEECENIKNSAHYMCDGARPNYTQYFVIYSSLVPTLFVNTVQKPMKYSDFDHHEKRTEILYKG